MLNAQGDAYADLAEVLLLGGKAEESAAALEQALDRYERKGNLVMAHGCAIGWRLRWPRHQAPRDWASRVRAPSAAFLA